MGLIFAVNENNDIYATPDGNLATRTGLSATLQQSKHVMKSLLGEMIYNMSRGIDYFGIVFVGSPNLLQFEIQAKTELLRIPEIEDIVSFKINFVKNGSPGTVLEYFVNFKTIYGPDLLNDIPESINGII